jgi:rod shape determining protein RodA
MWSKFKTLDIFLFLVPVVLMGISVVVIYTLTSNATGGSTALRQALFGVISLLLMLLFTFIDYRSLRAWAGWAYGAGLLLLIGVETIGKNSFGATRWIDLGFFQFQPGEIMKLVLIILMAALLSKSIKLVSWRRFMWAGIILVVPVVTVLLQPDFGTALVVLVSGIGILFHARITRLQKLLIVLGIVLATSSVVLSFNNVPPFSSMLKQYQRQRLASFIDPKNDTSDSGYNVEQSTIAVGSGGLTGKGFVHASQSQLNFLPVAHADFIFAAIAEVWGLLGSYGIILAYLVLVMRILHAARIAKDEFGALICVGIIVKLLFEVLVNIGMNIGIMPVTGIPLPFLSYGGTTMLTNAMLIGIVQSIVIRYKRLTF